MGRKEVGGALVRLGRLMELGCGKQLESWAPSDP